MPARIPYDLLDLETAQRSWVAVLSDRNRVRLERVVPLADYEDSRAEVGPQREGCLYDCGGLDSRIASCRGRGSRQLDLPRSGFASEHCGCGDEDCKTLTIYGHLT